MFLAFSPQRRFINNFHHSEGINRDSHFTGSSRNHSTSLLVVIMCSSKCCSNSSNSSHSILDSILGPT